MLTIGELARRAGVSVRMLRHYDRLGLITPVRVDETNGYRWYAPSQLGRVTHVRALRDLGFSLGHCCELLDDTVPADVIRYQLARRRTELRERIDDDTRRLAELDRRLNAIDRGLTMTHSTLRLEPLPALRLLHVRTTVRDTTDIGEAMAELREQLPAVLAVAGVRPEGPRIHTYFGRPDGATIDVAVGHAVEDPPMHRDAWPSDLLLTEIPEEPRGATVTYDGPAAEIATAWAAFDVTAQGLQSHGLQREVHLSVDEAAGTVVVELQTPVRSVTECAG